ncbi:MAG: alpha/beta hydrolase [Candidatus Saccharibacteria bacterium]|nr:alpha/beta hydrolase [Moraxellaceae bacterium]
MVELQTTLPDSTHTQRKQPEKPRVYCQENGHNRKIISNLHQLNQVFRPTPWLFNSHMQLMFLSARKNNKAQAYDHTELLTMSDGGQTALAWMGYDLPVTTPTIVVLHTLTGSPQSMQELVVDLHQTTGWRIVLCVRRGHAEMPLTQPQFNIFGSVHDLHEQLSVIQARLPESTLYGVGSSAGSGLLVRYLGVMGQESRFHAAFAYSPGYNTDTGFDHVHPFYSRYMAKKLLRKFVEPNIGTISHLPTAARLRSVRNLSEFNHHAFEFAGYSSYEKYANDINPMNVFTHISVPMMVLNAEDDPVCNIQNVKPYLDTMRSMPNLILVTTAHGSHCAHYEGWRAKSWAARLIGQYLKTVHELSLNRLAE